MKIQFNPKHLVQVKSSLESQFTQEVKNQKLKPERVNKAVTVKELRNLYQRIAEFGGLEMLKGKDEIDNNSSHDLEQAEKKFQESGYTTGLRGKKSPQAAEIENFRKKLINQFYESDTKN